MKQQLKLTITTIKLFHAALRRIHPIKKETFNYFFTLFFSFFIQVPLFGVVEEPNGDGEQSESLSGDAQIHRRDIDLGRSEWQLGLRVSIVIQFILRWGSFMTFKVQWSGNIWPTGVRIKRLWSNLWSTTEDRPKFYIPTDMEIIVFEIQSSSVPESYAGVTFV